MPNTSNLSDNASLVSCKGNGVFASPKSVGDNNMYQGGRSRLRAVVLLVRHGARYPLKPFPESTHWPQYGSFWEDVAGKDYPESHAGHLTKVGHKQLKSLGEMCRGRYLKQEGFFDDNNPLPLEGISAYSSNVERTEKSAKSFLEGMFPEAVNDIQLQISKMKYCILLHGFRRSSKFKAMQTKALYHDALCGQLHSFAESKFHRGLTEKLWNITGFEKLDPAYGSIASRLMHFQTIAQMIRIEHAHNIPFLMNRKGAELGEDEVEGVMDIADRICHLRYTGCNVEEQREMSRFAAGLLPMTILELFRQVKKPGSINRFQLYSAHDNTIMAMLAFIGFENWPIPQFAAHLIFELYERDGQWEVEFMYNSDPQCHAFVSDASAIDSTPQHGQHTCSLLRPLCKQGCFSRQLSRQLTVYEPLNGTITDEIMPGNFSSHSEKNAIYPVRFPRAVLPGASPVMSWWSKQFGTMKFEEFEEILLHERHCFRDQQEWDDAEKKFVQEALGAEAKSMRSERVKKNVGIQRRGSGNRHMTELPNQLQKSLRPMRSLSGCQKDLDEQGEFDDLSNSSCGQCSSDSIFVHSDSTMDPGSNADPDSTMDLDSPDSIVDINYSVDMNSMDFCSMGFSSYDLEGEDLTNQACLLFQESFVDSDSDQESVEVSDSDAPPDNLAAYNDGCGLSNSFLRKIRLAWVCCFQFCGAWSHSKFPEKNHGPYI